MNNLNCCLPIIKWIFNCEDDEPISRAESPPAKRVVQAKVKASTDHIFNKNRQVYPKQKPRGFQVIQFTRDPYVQSIVQKKMDQRKAKSDAWGKIHREGDMKE